MMTPVKHWSPTKAHTGHRTDKKQKFSDKVAAVNDILAADVK